MQKAKTQIKIRGSEYTVISSESPEYIHEIEAFVDEKICEFLRSDVNLTDSMATVLTAINLADEMWRAQRALENMRAQIGRYIDEGVESKQEINLLREENENLKEQLKRLKEYNNELKNKKSV